MLTTHRSHIDDALKIFVDRATLKPERARATFTKSEILLAAQEFDEANSLRMKCKDEYVEISGQVLDREPTSADFDDLVAFWSR